MKPIRVGSATTTSTNSVPLGRTAHDYGLYAASAVAFAAGTAATIAMCRSMAGGMQMSGGWTMSMAWMKMPGQSWPMATLMFQEMWLVMMVAMMTPSLVPMLARYRESLRRCNGSSVGGATLAAAIGYFAVWQLVGVVAYPLGVGLAAAAMSWTMVSRAVPLLSGAALLLCGAVQLTPWKMSKLLHCRDPNACGVRPASSIVDATKHGLELGTCCASCCSGFMLALMVLGTMDLGVMAAIAVAITIERLVPKPLVAVRVSGGLMIAIGVMILGRLGTF